MSVTVSPAIVRYDCAIIVGTWSTHRLATLRLAAPQRVFARLLVVCAAFRGCWLLSRSRLRRDSGVVEQHTAPLVIMCSASAQQLGTPLRSGGG